MSIVRTEPPGHFGIAILPSTAVATLGLTIENRRFLTFCKVLAVVTILLSILESIAENNTRHQIHPGNHSMAKPTHKVKKANHGKRPANNRGRKAKKKRIKTP